MRTIINITQIIVSLLLIAGILMQQRGGGLSAMFGGDGSVYRTRRGVEKIVFIATIVLSILFFLTAFLNIYLRP